MKKVLLYILLCSLLIIEINGRFQDLVNAKLKNMPTLNRRYSNENVERKGMSGLPGAPGLNSYSSSKTTTKMPSSRERQREQNFFLSLWNDYRKLFTNIANYRFLIFKENFQYVTTSRLDFHSGTKTFSVEMNQLSHLTIDEIQKHYTGARKNDFRRFPRSPQPSLKSLYIQKSIDYRKYMQSVTDQGKCSSCVAHAVSAAVEGNYALRKNIRFHLSRQMLIDCGWFRTTCADGSFIGKTLDLIQSIGLERTDCFRDAALTIYKRSSGPPGMTMSAKNKPTAQDWKAYQESLSCNGYRGGHPKCFCDVVSCRQGNDYGTTRDAERIKTWRLQGSDIAHIKKYVQLSDEYEMVSAIDQYGPLVASIRVTRPFFLLDENPSSIFSIDNCMITDTKNEGYHAIVIVGYGTDSKQTPYWLIRNSWSSNWGDNGYFKMIRNKNMCGIADETFYIVLE